MTNFELTMKKLPAVNVYMNTVLSSRRGHHVYVIEQHLMDLLIPLDELTNEQLVELDTTLSEYLKELDVVH